MHSAFLDLLTKWEQTCKAGGAFKEDMGCEAGGSKAHRKGSEQAHLSKSSQWTTGRGGSKEQLKP